MSGSLRPGLVFSGTAARVREEGPRRLECHLALSRNRPGIAQFESDLLSERVKSGLAAARARGKKLGRQPGQRPKSDRLAPKVLNAIDGGRSYRWIARDLGISKNTVTDIVKRANP